MAIECTEIPSGKIPPDERDPKEGIDSSIGVRSDPPFSRLPPEFNSGSAKLEDADIVLPTVRKSNGSSGMTKEIEARIQFVTLCWNMYLAGWNDASTGPLLPRIREVYHIGFAVVSLIFVLACVGFLTGAVINVPLSSKLGFGKIMVLGSLTQVIAYCLDAAAPPFPLFLLAFTINGIGQAVQDAQANGFVASLKDKPEVKMGFLHAAYGAGALSAPLVATQFAQLRRWSFHYLISLGIAILNTVLLLVVFRFRTQDVCLEEIGQLRKLAPDNFGSQSTATKSEDNNLRQIFSNKDVNLIAFFTLIYVGVEVTVGGWTVTYIIDQRHGGPSSGYVSAGFFGGLMIGRIALLWINKRVGEYRAIFLYSFLAIGLELIVWLVPSLIGDSVAVSLVGLLLGPMYPIIMNQTRRILDPRILTGSIGWIAGLGQAGTAVIPFMTGALASRFGISCLQPLVLSLTGLMIVMWGMVPNGSRKPND